MKLKITDKKIPGLLLLLGLLGGFVAQIAKDETTSTIGAVITTAASLLLILVYFPIITIKLFGDKIENKDSVVNSIGLFSITFIILALILRLFQLPGSGPFIVAGCVIFYLNFLPSWYAANYKKSDKYQRVLHFVFCSALGILLAAYQFKTMHWPWATIMLNLSFNFGVFICIPFGVFTLIFKRKKGYFNFNNTFLFGFIIAYVVGGIANSKLANRVFSSNNKTQLSIEKNLQLYEAKNKFLYDAFDKGVITDENFIHFKAKAIELKKLADSCDKYLYHLKTNLVLVTDKIPDSARDSITFDNIVDKTNVDHTTYLLIGQDESNPRKDGGSAIELKLKLQNFIKDINLLAPEEFSFQMKQSNPFDFNPIKTEEGGFENWEIMNFFHEPLSTIYTTITGYQANIRYLEMNLLNELFNKANTNNKDNMANQLAELAMKYESAQQEKKISALQKDQEMNDIKIQAKDAEISNREKTITYFIFGLIAFCILTIFVIRSNILRKQTNKELAKQKDIISLQKDEVENQKHLVDEKQKEIIESITYAKRLQEAILPSQEFINKHVPENFILYKPKDLVAGDFYWAEIINDLFFIAAADSTGHGVPGAMVSVVCSNALNRTVKEFNQTETGKILDKTRELVLETFEKSTSEVKDGMDISLLCIDSKNKTIFWSGANNPLWYFQDNTLKEIKADKQPIGKTEYPKPFTTHQIEYKENITFYLFTDGFADQFGGEKGKKFKYKQFSDLLVKNINQTQQKQAETINKAFEDWKGNLEQVDDVCVIGIKI